ncbi:MAG TPA: patatin-like phospholipase family protein [Ignavibacteria bacterium]
MRIKSIKILLFIILLLSNYSQLFSQISDTNKTYINLELKPKYNLDTNDFNIFPKKFNNKKVALVLSGGGARGLTQIGVLDALEKNDIDIDLIVGTSIGSVIGGLYASGLRVEDLKRTVRDIDWVNKLRLTDKYQREALFLEQKEKQDKSLISISLDGFIPSIPSSISSGYQILEFINLLFVNTYLKPKNNFRDLKIPFISVTTDFDKGQRFDIKSGNISEAVKASITFPLLYSPTIINGRNLVDGGLTANIPVDVAKENNADFVIAVNSTSPLKQREELDNPLNTADQIVSITMAKLNELQIAKADIVINPDIGNFLATDFSGLDFLLDKGEKQTLLLMDSIKTKIESLENSASKYSNNFIINPKVNIESDFILDSLRYIILSAQNVQFLKYTEIEKTLKLLYRTGYFLNVYAEVFRDLNGSRVLYKLENNPVFKDININSDFHFLDTLVQSFKKEHFGKIINTKSMFSLYENIYFLLRENQLPIAEINRFYLDYTTGIIDISITDGSINKIVLEGNKRTNNSVILRELKFSDNNIINYKDLEESLRNIYGTNLFKQISIDFDYRNNSLKPDLRINMVEKSSQIFRISMRADNERKLQLFFDLRDENLFGTGNEIGINTNGGLRNREYLFEMKSNRFFNTFYTYNFSLFYNSKDIFSYFQNIDYNNYEYVRINLSEYRDIKYGLSFKVGKQLERIGTIFGQIFYEKIKTNNISISSDIESEFNVLKIKFGGRIDTQNKIPFPTNGNLIDFYYETAQDKLFGNLSYSIFNFSFEQNISISKRSVVKPKFVFGFADKTTPLIEQFSLGGENSFYGMVEEELRGRQILLLSIEYRFMIPFKLFFETYISARYDLGQMWENAQDVRFKDLRHGIGLSLMFDTPVGKASFSGGRSLIISKGFANNSFIWGPYTFYFSIGFDL